MFTFSIASEPLSLLFWGGALIALSAILRGRLGRGSDVSGKEATFPERLDSVPSSFARVAEG